MTSWVKCCLERGRLRQRRKGNQQLDERYGDTSISGPMDGGWNQLPSYSSEKRSASVPASSAGSKRQREATTDPRRGHFNSCSVTQPFTAHPKELTSDKCKRSPDFLYKPASEKFFEDMAKIGKPRHPPPSSISNSDKHRRQFSTNSASSSLDPTSPAEIPCHPSYQKNMLLHRSPSPQLGSIPSLQRQSPSPKLSSVDSPALSYHSTLEEESNDLKNEEAIKYTSPPMTKLQPKKPKRTITDELVPSTTDLFG
ncbi:hypothetical protein LOZ66_001086 [Ophidiomyces ophidiicola]|nr:hypothetical protein LOZ66_001086 [Ophidiomyces ophidiicola]